MSELDLSILDEIFAEPEPPKETPEAIEFGRQLDAFFSDDGKADEA